MPPQLEVFGPLNLAAFGAGVEYPNARLEIRLVRTADQGQLTVTGTRCTVTPAG